jgi:hypothetical protein
VAFCFNNEDNGGESLILTTEMFSNGDPEGIYYNQELSLQSYCNSASFNLVGAVLTAKTLRMLADQLENAEKEAQEILKDVAVSGNKEDCQSQG